MPEKFDQKLTELGIRFQVREGQRTADDSHAPFIEGVNNAHDLIERLFNIANETDATFITADGDILEFGPKIRS